MKQSKKLPELLLTFFKIGLFTFGGGYAMIPIIENTCVETKKWITHDDMMNMTVIAESTPGPIAINCATFVGYRQAGLLGSIAATFGVILPSFIIIFAISMFLDSFLEITVIANAFKGIQVAVSILILDAGIKMIKKMQKKILPCAIMVFSSIIILCNNLFAWHFSSISLMLMAAIVSLAAVGVSDALAQEGGERK